MPERYVDVTVSFSVDPQEVVDPDFEQRIVDAIGSIALNCDDVSVSITERESDEDLRQISTDNDSEDLERLYAVDNLKDKLPSSLDAQFEDYLQRYNIPKGSMTRARTIFEQHRINEVRDILAMGSRRVEDIHRFGETASRNTKAVLSSLGFIWYEKPSLSYVAALYINPDKMPARIVDDAFMHTDYSVADLANKNLSEMEYLLDSCVQSGSRVWPRSDEARRENLTNLANYQLKAVQNMMAAFEEIKAQKL